MQSDQAANSAKAIVEQSKKSRYANQKDLIVQIERVPGDTATQAAWRFIGFSINDKGECVSANSDGVLTSELFAKMMTFFNAKRRLSEMSGDHIKNKKLQTAEPRLNPHADGVGLYPVGMSISEVGAIANGHLRRSSNAPAGAGDVQTDKPVDFGAVATANIGSIMDCLK